MALHRNRTIKNEIAKRNFKVKNKYLSKTTPISTKYGSSRPISSHKIRDQLTEIRLKHGSLETSSAQNDVTIKIGNAMNQLNDVDSRCVGRLLLCNIIDNIPDKLLHLVLEPFYAINSELSALCRKECALLIGYIASTRGSTNVFYSKYFHKVCLTLSRRAQDCDSRVREACGDAFGRITMQCIRFASSSSSYKSSQLISKMMKSIIVRIEKCISPHSMTGNFICLSNVISSADAVLRMDHIIVICKCLISNIINIRDAKTHVSLLVCVDKLMMMIITSDTGTTDYFSALLAIIMDGLTNKDWSVRDYALKAIHTVALNIISANIKNKTEIEKNGKQIMAHLQRLKYDKISNVRNRAIVVIAVWNNINDTNNTNHHGLDEKQNENISDHDSDIAINQQIIEKDPWFNKNDIKDTDESKINSNNDNNNDNNDNCNTLLLQQQELMLKTIKNLESYIHRELSNIKSRVHCVERDVQRMKVLQQNEEWMNDNKKSNDIDIDKPHNICRLNETIAGYDASNTDTMRMGELSDKSTENNENGINKCINSVHSDDTEMVNLNEELINDNKKSNNICRALNDSNVIRTDFETIAGYDASIPDTMRMEELSDKSAANDVYSDDTELVNLNEELLNILQLDNNPQLIRWLIQHNKYELFAIIDERLMISLIYRITQLLKNKKYINDIAHFVKQQFVIGVETVPKSFALPKQLKAEFLNTINQYENIKQYTNNIDNLI